MEEIEVKRRIVIELGQEVFGKLAQRARRLGFRGVSALARARLLPDIEAEERRSDGFVQIQTQDKQYQKEGAKI